MNPEEFIFTVCVLAVVLPFVWMAARLDSKLILKREIKSGTKIKCDICEEYMRPDGLHLIEGGDFLMPTVRMYRHPAHIIRTEILKQPIIDERLKGYNGKRKTKNN